MKSSYEHSVSGSAVDVWAALADVGRVLDALDSAASGAGLARADGGVAGSLRCRFGTTQVTYRLTARATRADHDTRSGELAVTGREARGTGALEATVRVTVEPAGDSAMVTVVADLEVTGRAEGVDAEHWSRVLSHLLVAALPDGPAAAPAPAPIAAPAPAPSRPAATPASATGPDRRPTVAVALVVVLVLTVRRVRRRRGRRR